jgi:hypothetical protein
MNSRLKDRIEEVTNKLEALRRQREGVDRQIEILTVQLEAYRDADALVKGENVSAPKKILVRPAIQHLVPVGFSVRLNEVLVALKKSKPRFATDDVVAALSAKGVPINRTMVRGRLADLVTKRSLNRISDGVFEFPAEKMA